MKKSFPKLLPIRRLAREWSLRFLYQTDVREEDFNDDVFEDFRDQFKNLTLELGDKEHDKIFKIVEKTVRGVLQCRSDVDQSITDAAQHWTLKRMSVIDRNILRIAVYEMFYVEEIPRVVSINEAVEISKIYGGDDSGKFINGILDKIGITPEG